MCGINGIIFKDFEDRERIQYSLSKMNGRITHRGPDDEGYFLDVQEKFSVGMGMRRLSIIDLNTGRQPILSEDCNKAIIFNGEIYNFLPLRSVLERLGVHFNTTSDTEVILKLYEYYGARSFSMLDGMFAFSIYDKSIGKVYIARDFFGEKPLYYSQTNNSFLWSSELKSIMAVLPFYPEISIQGLNLFFQLTYIPSPFTIYSNIQKLEPNHYLSYDCYLHSFTKHEIVQEPVELGGGLSEVKAAIRYTHDLVQKSVKSRSIADVSLGSFLSGGVDSSIISLCLSQQTSRKIDTFSIGFSKAGFDESEKARLVAKQIRSNHHEFIIGEGDFIKDCHKILLNFDEPFADSSALPSFIVANRTSKSVKVALTGDGADEMFGGYNKYLIGNLNMKYTSLVPEKLHDFIKGVSFNIFSDRKDRRGRRFKILKLLDAVSYNGDFYYNIISLGFQSQYMADLIIPKFYEDDSLAYYKSKFTRCTRLKDFRMIDRELSLEGDMLVKVDRVSMLNSLECRAPFLNKEIWNFTNQIPDNYLIHKMNKKYLLKKAFEKYFPKGFLDQKKKGFQAPVGDWLRAGFRKEIEKYIGKEFIRTQGIFNYNYISDLVRSHLEGRRDSTFKIWTFYCFQNWYEHKFE